MTPDFEAWREERIRTRQYSMTAGAVIGGILVLWFVILAAAGNPLLTVWPVTYPLIVLSGVAWSVHQARRRLQWFYFPKALSTGLSVCIYASFFIGSVWFLYVSFVNTGFISDLFDHTQEQMILLIPESAGAEKAEEMKQDIINYIETTRAGTTPLAYAAAQACHVILIGGLAALVSALVCKARRPKIVIIRKDGTDPDDSGVNNQN